MRFSGILGSYPAIAAVLVLPYVAQHLGVPVNVITFQLSVLALTLTQLVLREQNKDTAIDKQIQSEQLQVERRIEKEIKDA